MDLSVIVPVYNVEKYLSRCIDSIIKQLHIELEIIIINDGSDDGSLEIAKRFEEKYENLRVISQNNKGLSGARNTGLRSATGTYVVFVDSDDWLIENTLERLFCAACKYNLDVGVADFQYVDENRNIKENCIKPTPVDSVVDGRFFFEQNLENGTCLMMVWKSIYRRSFLVDNGLWFREGYNHEDEEWTPRVYLAAKRIKVIPLVFYCYFQNTDSISKRPSDYEKNSYDMIANCYSLREIASGIEEKRLRELFQDNIAICFLSAFYKGKLLSRKYKQLVNGHFFDNMHLESKTKKKVRLFKVSKYIYFYMNKAAKKAYGGEHESI